MFGKAIYENNFFLIEYVYKAKELVGSFYNNKYYGNVIMYTDHFFMYTSDFDCYVGLCRTYFYYHVSALEVIRNVDDSFILLTSHN